MRAFLSAGAVFALASCSQPAKVAPPSEEAAGDAAQEASADVARIANAFVI